jgi:hypothetical protein
MDGICRRTGQCGCQLDGQGQDDCADGGDTVSALSWQHFLGPGRYPGLGPGADLGRGRIDRGLDGLLPAGRLARVAEKSLKKLESQASCNAGVAQLVERNLAKVEVASSRLVSRSNYKPTGGVAEWLCSGLQSRGRRFDSDPRLQIFNQINGLANSKMPTQSAI